MKGTIPDWMIIDSTRYAIGRMTYQVQTTCDWLVQNWGKLSEHTQTIIKSDLETEFKRDDKMRQQEKREMWLPLGHNCDREQWERVRALWRV